MPAGRPTKLTPEVAEQIAIAVRAGNYLETASAHAGIDRLTLHAWMRRGARERSGVYYEFNNSVKKALADAETNEVALITKAARDGAWQAAAWKLERRNPARWGARVRVTVEEELNANLDKLERGLKPEAYEEVLRVLGGTGSATLSGETDGEVGE